MSNEKIKVIVEINGGNVTAVYAGSPANPLIEVVTINHDLEFITEIAVKSWPRFDAHAGAEYDGDYPKSWYPILN